MRSNGCGDLREQHIDAIVQLCGWVDRRRDHGGVIFIDLRDRSGTVQITVDPDLGAEAFAVAEHLRSETVLQVSGKVRARPAESLNDKLATGAVEVLASGITVLNSVKGNLPFPVSVHDEENTREELRLRHRYLDLRRKRMNDNLRLRAQTIQAARRFLEAAGFIEVETPVLTRSTPEGARDYVLPSRVCGGEWFALPQSPQLFKQLLMVGGIERYYQVARCFRDEDLSRLRTERVVVRTSSADKFSVIFSRLHSRHGNRITAGRHRTTPVRSLRLADHRRPIRATGATPGVVLLRRRRCAGLHRAGRGEGPPHRPPSPGQPEPGLRRPRLRHPPPPRWSRRTPRRSDRCDCGCR